MATPATPRERVTAYLSRRAELPDVDGIISVITPGRDNPGVRTVTLTADDLHALLAGPGHD